MANESPLLGVRVVEACGWAGAYAGRLLAEGGAEVVRVVPPGGDFLDRELPFFGDSGVSIQAAWYNAGKRIVTADLATDAGRAVVADLCRDADILLEDHGAETTDASPRVRVTISPFGEDGPWSDFAAPDLIANALSGAASVTGNADTPPLTGYGNQTYHTVGMYAAICALASLRAARATGEPQHVDLSSHEALIGCTEQVLMQRIFPGPWGERGVAQRLGSLHWSRAYEIYPGTRNEGIMVTAALNFMGAVLPWMIEDGAAQDLADPDIYPDILALVKDFPHVMQVMREWVAGKDEEEMFFESQRRHQPFGVVRDIPTALSSPQIAARGYLQPQNVPGAGTVMFPGGIFQTSADGPHPSVASQVTAAEIGWTPRPSTVGDERTAGVSATKPLAGVRIMDFTHVLAGPFGTRVLGDLGADVIKIGTALRGGGANSTAHPYYCMWNRNKRSLSLNMASEEGRALARELASQCDVIIENFSAGVLKRWGLDRAGLAETAPGVTVITMGGMGQTGPWSNFVTFAPTIHALVGLTYLTNPPGERLLGYGFSLTDHLSGLAGALAALEAVEHRRRTGLGLDIDLSQYELGLGLMAPALIDHLANGTNPTPVGNRHPFAAWAPHGIYRCAGDDRWVAIAARGDDQWRTLCGVMGTPSLADDPRFATHEARIANQDALDAAVEAWTSPLDRYDVMTRCQAAGIAAGAVQDGADLFDNDPQLAARGFFTTMRTDPWGEHGVEVFPARFSGDRPSTYDGAHQPGEDTYDVVTGVMGIGDE
ncbi:hypothetical protein AYO38_09705, partial [bacterium SCGC AG-212-C10]